ncbi:MAG: outer membrane protein assembly factor BamA [Caulobacteraceae bacterium]|nr:outer membrane protein assembly factor BamA [Caulobacter sp.]
MSTGENRTGVVRRILVEGNERIESSTIVAYLPFGIGDTVGPAQLDLAIKTLNRTDLFSDERVTLDPATGDLTVRVIENPIINQVVFEGNSALADDKLRDEVSVHPRGIFTKSHVLADTQRIIELYRRSGRISATVTPKIVNLPQKRVDLVFEINEGPKTGILRVNFDGNKAFSDSALRDVVVTKESRWYRFFSSNDNYDPDRIEYDREQLRKYYVNRGYYDFKVISSTAELLPDQKNFVVTYVLDEGQKYKFGKLTVTTTNVKRLNANFLRAILPIKQGQQYQADRIEGAVDSLTFAAGAAGFAFVDIRPRQDADPKTHLVNINFDVREGPRVYVERIDVVGNTATQDYVIRRELALSEGDAYNRVLVDRSKLNVKRLNFFKTVDIDQLPGSAPDKTALRVKVQEQPTGQLSLGAGYSTVDKLLLDVGVEQNNFRGTGQSVSLRASVGSLRQQIDFRFTEPRFLGRNIRGGFDLFAYKYDFTDYSGFDSESVGGTLRAGFPLNLNTYLQTRYTIHQDHVSVANGLCDTVGTVSVTICDQRGDAFYSTPGYTLSFDTRNDPRRATRGFQFDFSQDLAGAGGDVHYLKTEGDFSIYHGFSPNVILKFLAQAGYILPYDGDVIRINDRFYKGGDTFRGFEIAGIGPRDTSVDEALGGRLYGIGTFELAVPNYLPEQYGIRTSLFTDFGTVGVLDESVKRAAEASAAAQGIPDPIRDDLALRASAGISVFWTSPLGPIRLDFSKVLAKTSYDRTETFRFSTNTSF